MALVPTNVLIWLKKLKTNFGNSLLLLLIDELVCLKWKIQKFRVGKIKHTKINKYVGDALNFGGKLSFETKDLHKLLFLC